MPRPLRSAPTTSSATVPPRSSDRLGLIAKILGLVVAIFSVIFGANQLTGLVTEERERDRHVAELITISAAEQRTAQYSAARSHLEDAQRQVDPKGIIAQLVGRADRNRELVRSRQEDLATAWL